MHQKCKEENCSRKAFQIDKNENGEPVALFQIRHNGKPHFQPLTEKELREIADLLNEQTKAVTN